MLFPRTASPPVRLRRTPLSLYSRFPPLGSRHSRRFPTPHRPRPGSSRVFPSVRTLAPPPARQHRGRYPRGDRVHGVVGVAFLLLLLGRSNRQRGRSFPRQSRLRRARLQSRRRRRRLRPNRKRRIHRRRRHHHVVVTKVVVVFCGFPVTRRGVVVYNSNSNH